MRTFHLASVLWTSRRTVLPISITGTIIISICVYLSFWSSYVGRLHTRPKGFTEVSNDSRKSSVLNAFVENLKAGTIGSGLGGEIRTTQLVAYPDESEVALPAWRQYINEFSTKVELYNPDRPYLSKLLRDLATVEINQTSILHLGTQFKFQIEFVDGNIAIAKPMRVERNYYSPYDTKGSYLRDFERHTAEIAAFHLDRILDFRRVTPCAGRALNFRRDILQKTKDPDILGTQRVKDGNQCIIGSCHPKFCNEQALTCAKNGTLEVALCQKVPDAANMQSRGYPWRSTNRKKPEEIALICQNLKKDKFVQENGFFLDFMETLVFDHLQVNYDRHNYKKLNNKDSTSIGIALLDNGKGFGNPLKDDITFLTPIKECCRFRNSTYQRMLQLTKDDSKLGDRMRASLSKDPLNPVLTEDFFPALDRRLNQAVDALNECISQFGYDTVFSELE
ncbi:Extracellular serine/threonine protein kinase FAM20C [Holothuria leucospilota]|uniref:Extracellular serine/threonine protein kinase FAM20C n=1 Tax=Holothuria leucospilota TaxID=206669 RepID=A0A9Q1HC81_HOLLE|nr:Extracellular serine/threonine protein kinase FAM20C [Holothuria leucospilota]